MNKILTECIGNSSSNLCCRNDVYILYSESPSFFYKASKGAYIWENLAEQFYPKLSHYPENCCNNLMKEQTWLNIKDQTLRNNPYNNFLSVLIDQHYFFKIFVFYFWVVSLFLRRVQLLGSKQSTVFIIAPENWFNYYAWSIHNNFIDYSSWCTRW